MNNAHAIYIYIYATDDAWTGQGYGEKVDSFHYDTFWPGVSWRGGGGGGTTCHRAHFAPKRRWQGQLDSDGTLLERIWKYYIIR
jgi:hypothetical protein